MSIYSHLIGYVSERTIRNIRVYCVQARGVYYVSYLSGGASSKIVSAPTEEAAYQKWSV